MRKKAQGMPLRTIVIAALVLIVLIVLIIIFTGRAGFFARGVTNQTGAFQNICEIPGTGRKCMDYDDCIAQGGFSLGTDYKDCQGLACCQL